MSSSEDESVSSSDTQSSTQTAHATPVFIKDSKFCWLPALLVRKNKHTATVKINLPENWTETTCCDNFAIENSERLTIDLSDYPGGELPLQNVDEDGKMWARSDMSDLPQLHEAAVLYNLKNQHAQGVPYTRVGDIIVATNPFCWIDGLYSQEKQNLYANRLVWNAKTDNEKAPPPTSFSFTASSPQPAAHQYTKLTLAPHVYESSSHAYRGLAIHNQNQAILVTGESGAGKTETVKIVMTHLAKLHHSRPGVDMRSGFHRTKSFKSVEQMDFVVQKVLEANPVFEAFGNAKTVRNNNSSRFGKFTQLQFDVEENHSSKVNGIPHCVLAGSVCDTYLLEKSRVVGHAVGERTYHIFYQLLAAPEEFKRSVWAGLEGTDIKSFRYLCTGAVEEEDAEDWSHTVRSLGLFGIFEKELDMLMRALCIVLQLGNLTFASNSNEQAIVKSTLELEKVADLMGLSPERVSAALTKRQTITRGEVLNFGLSPDAAKENSDALAKKVYEKVFDVVVMAINEATRAALPDEEPKVNKEKDNATDSVESDKSIPYGVISLLDIFGFEKFKINRFEQLCINYANERLQQKYVTDVFKSVTAEYLEEGIEIFDFSMVDNTEVVTLIEGRSGIISALNEECKLPKGNNDSNFVYKIKKMNTSSILINEKIHRPTEFGIMHFAAPVKYDATKFVERNNDVLPPILIDLACDSSNSLLQKQFQQLKTALSNQNLKTKRRSQGNKTTVVTKFRTQLNQLMASMKDSKIRYIRCIKPNPVKLPVVMDHDMALSQLSSAGLVTAIIIQRETFPNSLPYSLVLGRFRCLIDKATGQEFDGHSHDDCLEDSEIIMERVKHMLTLLLGGNERRVGGQKIAAYACGKTKVFFRSGALETLETHRMNLYQKSALTIQSWIRCLLGTKEYLSIRKFIVGSQATWRGFVARKAFCQTKNTIVVIQSWARVILAKNRLKYLKGIRALIHLQAKYRTWSPKRFLCKHINAAILIQTTLRARKHTSVFGEDQAVRAEEVKMGYKLRNLLKKLNITDKNGKHSFPESLLNNCQEMLVYGEHESEKLRELIVNVQVKAEEQNEIIQELESEKESSDDALIASQLEIAAIREIDATHRQNIQSITEENANLKEKIISMEEGCEDVAKNQEINKALEKNLADLSAENAILQESIDNADEEKKYQNDMDAVMAANEILKERIKESELPQESHKVAVKSVPEEEVIDIRLQLELARNELAQVRTENFILKEDLGEEELCNQSSAKCVAILKEELRNTHANYYAETSTLKETITAEKEQNDKEVKSLQQDLKRATDTNARDEIRITKLRSDVNRSKGSHRKDVKALQDELELTLDAYNKDISEVFDAFESKKYQDETIKIMDDFFISSESDNKLFELKMEIASMKRLHAVQISKMEKELELQPPIV